MKLFPIILSLLCLTASGSTYYVSTTGSDANPGSSASPWATLYKASTNVAPGDSVTVRAGTYNERLRHYNSGTVGSPITWAGERGPNGQWLTIIDPSTAFTNGWVAAPEIGTGVYKQTGMPFETQLMTVDGKMLASVSRIGDMSDMINAAYVGSGLTSGSNFLSLASNATLTPTYTGQSITWWDTVGALYCADMSTTYIRFRDGSSPNGRNIRCSPNIDGTRTKLVGYTAVFFPNASFITFKNFKVQGAYCGIYLALDTHHITVQSNYVQHGDVSITLSYAPYECSLLNNEVTANYYGTTNIGAWEGMVSDANKANTYFVSKFLSGEGYNTGGGIRVYMSLGTNLLAGNNVHDSLGIGMDLGGYYDPANGSATNLVVCSNRVVNHPSSGIMLGRALDTVKIYDNTMANCDIGVRIQPYNETNNVWHTWFYRNTLWNPPGLGEGIFVNLDLPEVTPSYDPDLWFYNNSFSGGFVNLFVGRSIPCAGIRFLNNIVSSQIYYSGLAYGATNATSLGAYDYNLTANASVGSLPPWFGLSNLVQTAPEWADATTALSPASNSKALGAALDTTSAFTLRSVSYPALPQDSTVKVGAAWDIGALEYSAPLIAPANVRVGKIMGR